MSKDKAIHDFLNKFTKDDSLFKAGDESQRLIFTAGFIRGATWMVKQLTEKQTQESKIFAPQGEEETITGEDLLKEENLTAILDKMKKRKL